MSVKINYLNKILGDYSKNLVLFSNEKFNSNGLKKYFKNDEYQYIQDLLKTSDLKKKILSFDINSKTVSYTHLTLPTNREV